MIAGAPGESGGLVTRPPASAGYPFGIASVPSPDLPYVGPDTCAGRRSHWPPVRIDRSGWHTVAEFNRNARLGEDPECGRGRTPFNRGSGDPEHGPNPSLAPIEKPPFYAIKVLPGSFGTFAGLRTDPQSRVLDGDGAPIPGLYAAGSDQANVMGGHTVGRTNIGPAMT